VGEWRLGSFHWLVLESDGKAVEEGTVCNLRLGGVGTLASHPTEAGPHTAPGWAHVVCALYIPEVQFANVLTMEPIVLQYVPHDRFNKVSCPCHALVSSLADHLCVPPVLAYSSVARFCQNNAYRAIGKWLGTYPVLWTQRHIRSGAQSSRSFYSDTTRCSLSLSFLFLLFFLFWWNWASNSELCACQAGTLLLEPHLQSIFLCYFRDGVS
jgi:hypothetical protein